MRTRQRRSNLKFSVESLEVRSLLSGGMGGHAPVSPGTLNPEFGTGGVVTSAILGPTADVAGDVAIQTQGDGKIVLAGTVRGVTSQSAFAVARENADGSLDTRFGNGGTVFTNFATGTISTASALAIQPNGKILVAGTVEGEVNGNFIDDFAVARYNTDGSLDTSFGTGGEVTVDFGLWLRQTQPASSSPRAARSLWREITTADGGDFALVQLNKDGSLDQKIGSGGIVQTSFGASGLVATEKVSAVVAPNGQIVLAGSVFPNDFALARYNANGSLDTAFGTGGLVTTTFGSSDVFAIAGVGLEPKTNAIVVAGTIEKPAGIFPVGCPIARFTPPVTVALTPPSATGGEVVITSPPGTTTAATGMAIQPRDGAIVVTGTTITEDNNQNTIEDLTVERFKARRTACSRQVVRRRRYGPHDLWSRLGDPRRRRRDPGRRQDRRVGDGHKRDRRNGRQHRGGAL